MDTWQAPFALFFSSEVQILGPCFEGSMVQPHGLARSAGGLHVLCTLSKAMQTA